MSQPTPHPQAPALESAAPEGLSSAQAHARLVRDGPNALAASKPYGALHVLREVLTEPMFLLLVACGAVYLVLGDRNEALMLLGFVVVVIGITYFQQRRTERSLAALRGMASPRALVLRDGRVVRIPGCDLVCGDRVLLAEGDRVPADLELLESSNLMVDESLLTGESAPVHKWASRVGPDGVATTQSGPEADALRRLFSGTLVTQGNAAAQVVATGARSALGRIGQSLASIEAQATPVQREMQRVVRRVATVGLALASVLADYG